MTPDGYHEKDSHMIINASAEGATAPETLRQIGPQDNGALESVFAIQILADATEGENRWSYLSTDWLISQVQ